MAITATVAVASMAVSQNWTTMADFVDVVDSVDEVGRPVNEPAVTVTSMSSSEAPTEATSVSAVKKNAMSTVSASHCKADHDAQDDGYGLEGRHGFETAY